MGRPPRDTLATFFLLTYAVMWSCFITVAAGLSSRSPLGLLLIHLGAYSPSLVALWLTARAEGRAGVRVLLAGVVRWRVPARFYLFAVGYVPAVRLTVALVHRLVTGAWPRFGDQPWLMVLLAVAFSTPFQAGEEIGWRGYALPRLAGRFGLRTAGVLLGLIWGVWHLPQFFIADSDEYGRPFFLFVAQVVALSVAMAWLYARTNGSLLPVMLLHSAVNNAAGIVSSPPPGSDVTWRLSASLVSWLTLALLWVGAAGLLARMPEWKPASGPAP